MPNTSCILSRLLQRNWAIRTCHQSRDLGYRYNSRKSGDNIGNAFSPREASRPQIICWLLMPLRVLLPEETMGHPDKGQRSRWLKLI
jgi:hypothetical protein